MKLKLLLLLPILITSTLASEPTLDDMMNMSIEELLNVEVSGITRQDTKIFKATSAVFVISNEEIRRFGATSIPELLQMVPGFNVGRLSGNMWAINARGPNKRLSRDLLMMIDGRNVYSPTVNNIYWDHIDTVLEDIERIEIVRGPGSSLWGSNAANGIINIVTKNSQDTEGFMLSVSSATKQLDYQASTRYGFKGDNFAGRIYAKTTKIARGTYPSNSKQSNPGKVLSGAEAYDGKTLSLAGFRTDINFDDEVKLMLNAEFTKTDTEEVKTFSNPSREIKVEQDGAFIISSIEVAHSSDIKSKLQAYIDYHKAHTGSRLDERTVYDLDFQNEIDMDSFVFLWGAGYRRTDHRTEQDGNLFVVKQHPQDEDLQYYSGFVQIEYDFFDDKASLTVGSKYEHNDYTYSEYMPNIRLGIFPNENHTIWASVSKAVSTPSRSLADGYLDLSGASDCSIYAGFGAIEHPTLGCVLGFNTRDGLESSEMYVYEAGYRININDAAILDQSVFYNKYEDHNAETENLDYVRGYEVNLRYIPRDDLKIDTFYSFHEGKNLDGSTTNTSDNIPKHTFGFRTAYDLTSKIETDLFYRYVAHVKKVDHINQLNLRFGYKFTKNLDASLFLSNLLDGEHVEANTDSTRANSYVERAALLKLTYTY